MLAPMADPAQTTPDRPAQSATARADGSAGGTIPDPPDAAAAPSAQAAPAAPAAPSRPLGSPTPGPALTPAPSFGPEVRPGDPGDPLSDEQRGRYHLRKEYGRGGQAVVYLAFDAH